MNKTKPRAKARGFVDKNNKDKKLAIRMLRANLGEHLRSYFK